MFAAVLLAACASTRTVLANPQGCIGPENKTQIRFGGTWSDEEIQWYVNSMQTTGVKADKWYKGKPHVKRCPLKQTSALKTILGRSGPLLSEYLDMRLGKLHKTEPVVVSVAENLKKLPEDSKMLAFNFVCGMARIGLAGRLVLLVVDEDSLAIFRKQARVLGDVTLLYHEEFHKLGHAIARRSAIPDSSSANRILKMLVPLLLLERGYTVILADLDEYWVASPLRYLRSLHVDMASMADICRSEINAGFVYFRPSKQTLKVLQTALSLRKELPRHILSQRTINDQFLLNCANAYILAEGGFKSWLLPVNSFSFRTLGFVNRKCRAEDNITFSADDAAPPFVFHISTGLHFDATSSPIIPMLKRLNFWDLARDGLSCISAPRGSAADQRRAAQAGYDSCRTVIHEGCQPSMCK